MRNALKLFPDHQLQQFLILPPVLQGIERSTGHACTEQGLMLTKPVRQGSLICETPYEFRRHLDRDNPAAGNDL